MQQSLTIIVLLNTLLGLWTLSLSGQNNIKYGPNYFVFEAEDTQSPLDLWVLRSPADPAYYTGTGIEAINQTYIEFTGNTLNGGAAKSPLTYTFTCPKTAKYRVAMRMYQPLAPNEAGDKRNDVWIKLTGNYTPGTAVYPQNILESNHKFWGRGVRQWGTCHSLEAHVNGVKKQNAVIYNLIKGETYTFSMSGRSQGCSIDYILFYENSLGYTMNGQDLATNTPSDMRPYAFDVTTVTLDTSDINLENLTDTYQLIATVKPDTASDKTITWSSADPAIATVDATGLVTAVSNGTTTISATANASGISARCEVLVGKIIRQPIAWSAKQLTGEIDVLTDGTLLEAVNFAGGTDPSVYKTTLNTVTFEGKVSNRTDNVWQNPATDYFSASSIQVVPPTVDIYDDSIGLPIFDVLLSKFLWTNGIPTVVTFSNLTVGRSYKIQFFAADTRNSQAGSWILLEDEFGSPDTTHYTESNGLSIIGEFTAIAESFSFEFSKVTEDGIRQGINLNAYQLREIGATSLDQPSIDQTFIISPNPAQDWIRIELTESDAAASVTLLTLEGKTVFQKQLSNQTEIIHTHDMSPGIYLIQVNRQGRTTHQKLIIH